MNVWLVFPRFKMPTGAERLILGLARGLVERGHAATVVTHEFDARCRALVAPGVVVHASGRRFAWTGNHYLDSAIRYVAGAFLPMVLPAGAEVAIFFAAASVPALAVQRLCRNRTRSFYFCFEPPRFAYRDRAAILARLGGVARAVIGPLARAWAWLDRRLVRRAERVLVFGPFIEGQVRELYPDAPVARVTPCVDVPAARLARGELRLRLGLGDAPIALTVNFLHPRKRVDLFLAAIAEVARRHPDVVGVVVGEGPERERLEALATRLGIGRSVRFAGFVPDEELGSWYRMASVYVHSAHDESFGLTVLEAGSSGVPVVAVREGGVCETLEDGVTAVLVEADARALADGVSAVLDDRALAARLAAEAAERLPARFSHERMIDELLVALR